MITNSRDSTHKDLPGHTDEDRERIRSEAIRSVLDDVDGDRTDPTWLRYCERHGLDAQEAGREPDPEPPAVITCERCGRTTTDPDRWDPEADTGRIFCDPCWDRRDEPMDTRTVTPKGEPLITRDTYFADFEVPETASSYRVLVYRAPPWPTIIISVVNWGTSAEYGVWPAEDGMQHSLAEHLFHGNLVDAENLIHVLRHVAATWEG